MTGSELADRLFEQFNRRDLDGWLSVFQPDGVLVDHLTLGLEPYRGHEQLARWFRGWDRVWEQISMSELAVLDRRGDVLVLRWRAHARGRGSGLTVDQEFFGAVLVRDGLIARLDAEASEEDAYEAARALAGESPQDAGSPGGAA